ncbi:MAG TPA: ABC transporter substrate-binding protein [Ktedonosporobacter sp.]|nr:ABC transporter substrate-binding protein [Ktedonosporobacter sp.]
MEKNMERNLLLLVPMLVVAVFILLGSFFLQPPSSNGLARTTCMAESHVAGAIGYSPASNGDRVGLSDGLFPFDLQSNERQDQSDKIRASDLFALNDNNAATEWHIASVQDPTDAEVRIYEENESVLSSGLPCVTLAVGVALTGDLREGGRAILQGAYVAQKEYNDDVRQHGSGTLLRLLIANNGSDDLSTQTVARRIVKVAQSDRTFAGVMGWNYSAGTFNAIAVLGPAHIPLVSPTSSSDTLTNFSHYFFRIVPPDTQQIPYGVAYLRQLSHQRVALLQDPTDVYSHSLATAFRTVFTSTYGDKSTIISGLYRRGMPLDQMARIVREVLDKKPDMIFFSGYWSDASSLLINLQQITAQPQYQQFAQLPIMGGDALYELVRYQSKDRPDFSRLHFTAFASPDEWNYLCHNGQQAACNFLPAQRFARDYTLYYDDKKHPENSYGYNLADAEAILAYDGIMVMLTAYQNISVPNPTPQDLRDALAKITGPQAFQGISGQISFGLDGNPIDKAVVVVDVDSKSDRPQLVSLEVSDHFLKDT